MIGHTKKKPPRESSASRWKKSIVLIAMTGRKGCYLYEGYATNLVYRKSVIATKNYMTRVWTGEQR
jgi:hypothetical protein